MKFFSLIFDKSPVAPNGKVMSPEDYLAVVDGQELMEAAKKDVEEYKKKAEEEATALKEKSKQEGFESGLQQWNDKLAVLDQTIKEVREQVKNALVPLAIASIKKILGKELETNPDTVVSIITKSIKELTQNKKVVILVNPKDLETVEKHRVDFKKILEYVEVLIISAKADIEQGGCVIETETGIVNASLNVQLSALEKAFHDLLKKELSNPKTQETGEQTPASKQNSSEQLSQEQNQNTENHE